MIVEKNLYIHAKLVLVYMVMLVTILLFGYILKQYTIFLYYALLIALILYNKIDLMLLFLIAWIFTYRFFIGQQWISSQSFIFIIYNHNLSIILISILFASRLGITKSAFTRILGAWCLASLVIYLMNDTFHGAIRINAIYAPTVGLVYLIIRNIPKSIKFNTQLLNLIIAIGVFQVLMSLFQVTGTIAPSVTSVDVRATTMYQQAHIADVASGTMGANASNDTSWLETVLFVVLFSLGVYTKKIAIYVCSSVLLLQYATVDSKTALGVTVGVVVLMIMLQMYKYRTSIMYIITVVFVVLLMYGMYNAIDYYYTAFVKHDGIELSRDLVESSLDIALKDMEGWGKIRGFELITADLLRNGEINLFFGYGRDNYANTYKRHELEAMLSNEMRGNNFLNSFSTLINTYGERGISGIILLISFLYICMQHIKKSRYFTSFGKSFQVSGISIIIGSFILMFLSGGISYQHLSFLMFIILMALVDRHEAISVQQI